MTITDPLLHLVILCIRSFANSPFSTDRHAKTTIPPMATMCFAVSYPIPLQINDTDSPVSKLLVLKIRKVLLSRTSI